MSFEYRPSQEETEGFKAPSDETSKAAQERRKEQESEQHETLLQDHDLQVPERQVAEAKKLLEKLKVNFESIQLHKSRPLKGGGETGGQYILRISKPQDKSKPASFGYMREVFQYLRRNGITVVAGNDAVARNQA